jgi:putative transposase
MQRTIRIQLEPSPTQTAMLAETSRQFTAVFNAVCAYAWQQGQKNGIELHRALYYPLKADYPDLVSDLHVQARVKATETVKSALALKRKYQREQVERKVSQPHADSCPPRFNVHTYRVDWESQTVRLSLVGGRQTIRFRVLSYAAKYVGYPADTADLNAARNIAAKYHASVGRLPAGGLRNQPIVSNPARRVEEQAVRL